MEFRLLIHVRYFCQTLFSNLTFVQAPLTITTQICNCPDIWMVIVNLTYYI